MTQQGKAGKALKTTTLASVLGLFGEIVLILGAVLIATFTFSSALPNTRHLRDGVCRHRLGR